MQLCPAAASSGWPENPSPGEQRAVLSARGTRATNSSVPSLRQKVVPAHQHFLGLDHALGVQGDRAQSGGTGELLPDASSGPAAKQKDLLLVGNVSAGIAKSFLLSSSGRLSLAG